MNGYQRIKAALAGEMPDTTPIMLHNFMLAVREAGCTHRQFRSDPELAAQVFIQAIEKYGYDGMVIDFDTVTLAGAAGVPVETRDDGPANSHAGCLATLDEAARLAGIDIAQYEPVQQWLETVRRVKQYFGNEVYVRGNCDQAPFTLACALRTPQALMLDLCDEEAATQVEQLLEYCAGISRQFVRLMAQTGADMISNGDSAAGCEMISPKMYRRYALPGEQALAREAHAAGLPYTLHICGNATPILRAMLESEADALELDYKTDVREARETLHGKATFIGNVDPAGVLAFGTQHTVVEAVRDLLKVFGRTPGFILNAGCAISPATPEENLRAMIATARQCPRG
jgi:uroporphyrinogen decarboxylase